MRCDGSVEVFEGTCSAYDDVPPEIPGIPIGFDPEKVGCHLLFSTSMI